MTRGQIKAAVEDLRSGVRAARSCEWSARQDGDHSGADAHRRHAEALDAAIALLKAQHPQPDPIRRRIARLFGDMTTQTERNAA